MAFAPLICVVDFHHARGPEVERWFGVEEGSADPSVENDWVNLPFMALSDGAHASTEDYSYFTLRRAETPKHPASSLFGISCTRQLDASKLIDRPAEVTRSTVQKAVVVVSDSPQYFGAIKAQLGVVTAAWFAQRDFTDVEILQRFSESLPTLLKNQEGEPDHYFGISLREMIHEFKWQTLMLFFGSHCERLCMMQFALISLIPGLIRHLQDSADPKFNSCETELVMPTSLKTSQRSSLLTYMGLPLQLFGRGSLFGPYTPLQQLDVLADQDTKSYIVGSTNSLLLQQRDRYSDILINLDEHTVNITSSSLQHALTLSTPDRRWIDFLTQTVHDTWDESNPSRPKDHGYAGSEEFIRMQFEEYLLAMLSAVKFKAYQEKNKDKERIITEHEGDPAGEFSNNYIHAWMQTENFRIWNKFTDSHLFDIVEPKHPCSGGLSIEDVQRRLAHSQHHYLRANPRVPHRQIEHLQLDERLQNSREAIGKQLAVGQKKVSSAFDSLWAQMEAVREAQRKRQEESRLAKESEPSSPSVSSSHHAHANVQAASTRAGAYLSSWGAWASEKKKGWQASRSASGTPMQSPALPAEPSPGDIKRAEEFKRDKDGVVDLGKPLNSARTAPAEVQGEGKRESVFFDAEKDGERSKEAVT
ncbi:lalv9 family protein [Paraphaeosphaeria sporulosa]